MQTLHSDLSAKGYVDVPIPEGLDLREEILKLKREKNAVLLAHYYQIGDIQDVADYIGDSLGLSQQAAATQADMIVFCGVHFMAETAKILSPARKVVLPDLNAGCSLADSCPAERFAPFKAAHPDHVVLTYVNTTAAMKALSDVIVTSSNAVAIVESFPKEQPIIFAPDRNLGNYINSHTGRNMLVWDGACMVHEKFSLERILGLKAQHPDAKLISHPECQRPVLMVSDFIGSTSELLKYSRTDASMKYIVATESGILHQMRKANPQKAFIPAPPSDAACACSDCEYMKLNTMRKLYNCLKYELPEITLDEELRCAAEKPIRRMLEISARVGI